MNHRYLFVTCRHVYNTFYSAANHGHGQAWAAVEAGPVKGLLSYCLNRFQRNRGVRPGTHCGYFRALDLLWTRQPTCLGPNVDIYNYIEVLRWTCKCNSLNCASVCLFRFPRSSWGNAVHAYVQSSTVVWWGKKCVNYIIII